MSFAELVKIYQEAMRLEVRVPGKSDAVFYSGFGNREKAEEYCANDENAYLLGQTEAGKRGNQIYKKFDNEAYAELFNGLISDRFAREATGTAHAFVNGAQGDRIYRRVEVDTASKNENLNVIRYHMDDGIYDCSPQDAKDKDFVDAPHNFIVPQDSYEQQLLVQAAEFQRLAEQYHVAQQELQASMAVESDAAQALKDEEEKARQEKEQAEQEYRRAQEQLAAAEKAYQEARQAAAKEDEADRARDQAAADDKQREEALREAEKEKKEREAELAEQQREENEQKILDEAAAKKEAETTDDRQRAEAAAEAEIKKETIEKEQQTNEARKADEQHKDEQKAIDEAAVKKEAETTDNRQRAEAAAEAEVKKEAIEKEQQTNEARKADEQRKDEQKARDEAAPYGGQESVEQKPSLEELEERVQVAEEKRLAAYEKLDEVNTRSADAIFTAQENAERATLDRIESAEKVDVLIGELSQSAAKEITYPWDMQRDGLDGPKEPDVSPPGHSGNPDPTPPGDPVLGDPRPAQDQSQEPSPDTPDPIAQDKPPEVDGPPPPESFEEKDPVRQHTADTTEPTPPDAEQAPVHTSAGREQESPGDNEAFQPNDLDGPPTSAQERQDWANQQAHDAQAEGREPTPEERAAARELANEQFEREQAELAEAIENAPDQATRSRLQLRSEIESADHDSVGFTELAEEKRSMGDQQSAQLCEAMSVQASAEYDQLKETWGDRAVSDDRYEPMDEDQAQSITSRTGGDGGDSARPREDEYEAAKEERYSKLEASGAENVRGKEMTESAARMESYRERVYESLKEAADVELGTAFGQPGI